MSLEFDRFLSGRRTCLVAPAGYGKTHTIVECLHRLSGRILVLTHTQAGVASLRDKIQAEKVPSGRYNLSTISAFVQKLATSYTHPKRIPNQEDDRNAHYRWLTSRATSLMQCKFLRTMITNSYQGVIVDEYQDCTVSQHRFIMALASELSLWVLGDPLQGIFGFNEPLMDFETDLKGFDCYRLDVPWRWKDVNTRLGNEIASIRRQLLKKQDVDWTRLEEISIRTCSNKELSGQIIECKRNVPQGESLLVLATQKHSRERVARLFKGSCTIVEPIDDADFYELARRVDNITNENASRVLYAIASKLFFKTGVDIWLTEKGVKRKRSEEDTYASRGLFEAFGLYSREPSHSNCMCCLRALKMLPSVHLLWHDKYYSLGSAIDIASARGITAYQAMADVRNRIRAQGRCIQRFAVGTTHVTKCLEFDNVVVVDNPPYRLNTEDGRRNLYVAISRARKSLTIVRIG